MQRTPDLLARLADQAHAERASGVLDPNNDPEHAYLEAVEDTLRWALGSDAAGANLSTLIARMRQATPDPERALDELSQWATNGGPESTRFFQITGHGGTPRTWQATVFLDKTDRHPRAEGTNESGYVLVDADTYAEMLAGAVQVIREAEVVER